MIEMLTADRALATVYFFRLCAGRYQLNPNFSQMFMHAPGFLDILYQ